ncbi:MAG: HAMP domain-containing histidine kinase [Labilithrix sp.]|nr:HAMP domain-containing histidine kinase [Labilithrix sp.]MCW5813008.1 HAMP domain-containing histidine kinase [Labilithrix sp.]
MPTSRVVLPAIFAGVVLSFVTATAFVHWELRAIDDAALEIADDSAPGIEHLAAARSDLRHLLLVLRREPVENAALVDARHVLDRSLDGYLTRPLLPGEEESWRDVRRSKDELDGMLRRLERDDADVDDVLPIVGDVSDAITEALEASAVRTRESALRIRHLRAQSSRVALALDVVCALLALLGAYLVQRFVRADREIAERRRQLQEERAAELEGFAGRVAHDILSPLGAIGFALDILGRTEDPKQRARVVERGTSSLERIQRLVNGLLEFARAGGRPAVGARADVARITADLVAELEPTVAEKRIALTTKQDADLVAACDPGVLTSLIANLARNAIKYIGNGNGNGNGEEPRIEIRARERGSAVRVEVADNGPGLARELHARVFDPYVRAPGTKEPGVGLGLATVRRLAEAHGGRAGVESEVGRGATFWFEIPRSPKAPAPAPASHYG